MHRQGQGPQALRVRRQGLGCHHAQAADWRTVRAQRQIAPRCPLDGHTLKTVIPAIEQTTGAEIKRAIADTGYRGHGAPAPYDSRIYTSGQKRRMTPAIKRLMRRRSAVEPVIGH